MIKEDIVDEQTQVTNKKTVVTTQEELDTYKVIKEILIKNGKDVSELEYKDTTNYFSIHNKSVSKWLVRANFDANKKNLITKIPIEDLKQMCGDYEVEVAPKSIGESRVFIQKVTDLWNLEEVIVKAYELVN